jgi:hypothetical protein
MTQCTGGWPHVQKYAVDAKPDQTGRRDRIGSVAGGTGAYLSACSSVIKLRLAGSTLASAIGARTGKHCESARISASRTSSGHRVRR